jgi:hypothetical protein
MASVIECSHFESHFESDGPTERTPTLALGFEPKACGVPTDGNAPTYLPRRRIQWLALGVWHAACPGK